MQLLLVLLCLFASCQTQKNEHYDLHYFSARNVSKVQIYKAWAPHHWKRIDPLNDNYLRDTTLPICEFEIENKVKLSIHTFAKKWNIPPPAQVERWAQQFKKINETNCYIESVSHNGFSGLFFEAEGQWKDRSDIKMLAWSLTVDPFICQLLNDEEMSSDLTFKAIGSIDAIEKCRSEILQFVESFEFLKEMPFIR